MANARVGGEIDGYCTKCRLTLAHTILAMVGTKVAKVKCNTCGGEHALRAAPGASSPRATRSGKKAARVTKAEKVVVSFEQRLAEKDAGSAQPYSARMLYKEGALLQHPTFGLGIVTAVRQDKIDVDFKASQKTLVHGRGEAPTAHPSLQAYKAGATTEPEDASSESDAASAGEPVPSELDLPAEAGPT